MATFPRLVILESPPELRRLRAWAVDPNMPTLDVDAFYQTLFDTVLGRNIFYTNGLYSLATSLAQSDRLYGNNTLSQSSKDHLEQLICQAGHAIWNSWQQAKLNHPSGVPLYRFREFRDDYVLLFELRSAQDFLRSSAYESTSF
jgi:hypothetical protein